MTIRDKILTRINETHQYSKEDEKVFLSYWGMYDSYYPEKAAKLFPSSLRKDFLDKWYEWKDMPENNSKKRKDKNKFHDNLLNLLKLSLDKIDSKKLANLPKI